MRGGGYDRGATVCARSTENVLNVLPPNSVFLSITLLLLYDGICSECEYECKLPTL